MQSKGCLRVSDAVAEKLEVFLHLCSSYKVLEAPDPSLGGPPKILCQIQTRNVVEIHFQYCSFCGLGCIAQKKGTHKSFKRAVLTFHLPSFLSKESEFSLVLRILEYWRAKCLFFKSFLAAGCIFFQNRSSPRLLLISFEAANKFPSAAQTALLCH